METVWVLHTIPDPAVRTRIFGVAVGEGGQERLHHEIANYPESAQRIMTISGFDPLK